MSWGVANGVPLRARSGGHSYAGYSTLSGGMVLDLRNLRGISVDMHNRTATIGAGSQLIDVYAALAARGVTIPAGSCPSVGIAGHALGGGMGLAGRRFGLTADNVLSVQIVTADGRLRTANAQSNPDLYWALRGGGGGNFGVVTSFTVPRPPGPADGRGVHGELAVVSGRRRARRLAGLGSSRARSGHVDLPSDRQRRQNLVNVSGQYFGPAGDLGRLLAPLTAVGGAGVSAGNFGYLQAQQMWAGCSQTSLTACHTQGTRPGGTLQRDNFQAKSDYVAKPLPAAARQALVRAAEARLSCFRARRDPVRLLRRRDQSGQAGRDRVRAPERSVLHPVPQLRRGRCMADFDRRADAPVRHRWRVLQLHRSRPQGTGRRAYYGSNYPRLLKVRRDIDPHHYFNFPQAIGR